MARPSLLREHQANQEEQVYERIIVGYDGSDEAADALAFGRSVSEVTGGTLVLTHVLAFTPFIAEAVGARRPPERSTLELERERVEGELRQVAETCGAETAVVAGSSAVRGLHELAEEADLIVVGSTKRAGLGTVLLGSVGERLLQGAPCAVAVAPRGFRERAPGEPRVIAVAFDGSPESSQALEAAAQLTAQARATIRLLCAVQLAGKESLLREQLSDARDGLPEELRAAAHIVHGAPAAAIAEEAEKGVDVLFVGSRGYGPLRRAMLGSFSSALMSLAPCPVVVTPRGAAEAGPPARDPVAEGDS